jgi:hypothetical protein
VKAAADYLEVAPTVVAVARDLDLDRSNILLPRHPRDPDKVEALVEQWGLGSPAERLMAALSSVSA